MTQLRTNAAWVSATPALDTNVYHLNDTMSAVFEFKDVLAQGNGLGVVETFMAHDSSGTPVAFELWLFSESVTPAAIHAAHSISDADALKCIGVITSGTFYASALNDLALNKDVNLTFTAPTTSIFGLLVSRGTGTYGATDLTIHLLIRQG